jgi:hypothetical protein
MSSQFHNNNNHNNTIPSDPFQQEQQQQYPLSSRPIWKRFKNTIAHARLSLIPRRKKLNHEEEDDVVVVVQPQSSRVSSPVSIMDSIELFQPTYEYDDEYMRNIDMVPSLVEPYQRHWDTVQEYEESLLWEDEPYQTSIRSNIIPREVVVSDMKSLDSVTMDVNEFSNQHKNEVEPFFDSIQEQEQDIVHSKQDMPTSNSSSINLQSNNHNPTTDSVVEEMPDNQNHVRLETMATFHHASQHHTYRDSILYNHNRNVGIQDIEDDVSITSESNPKLTHDKILNVKDIDFDHDPSKQEVSVSSPVVKETNEDDMFVPEEEEKPLQRIRIIGKDRKLHGKYGTVLRKERQYFIIQVDGMEGEFRKTIKTIEFLDEPPSLDKNPTSSTGTTIMDLNQTTVKKNIPNRDMPTERKDQARVF